MITFLHTSDIHIPKFEKLVKKYNSKISVRHFVNAEMLSIALSTGKADAHTFGKEVKKIVLEKPDLIVCTCTYWVKAHKEQKSIQWAKDILDEGWKIIHEKAFKVRTQDGKKGVSSIYFYSKP